MDLMRLQVVLLLFVKVSAIVQDLDCNGTNNTFTLNGTNVIFTCEVQTASIGWDIQPLDKQISFNSLANDPGDNITIDGFTGIYIKETPPSVSTLNYILDLSLNETSVKCVDSGLPGNDMTCYILVINVPDPPEGVTNISCTYSSVEIQWSSPSFNGGSDIIRYHVTVEPPPSRIDTSCLGGECSTTDSNTQTYNITGVDYNQTYCFTVGAENVAGIKYSSELCVFVTANAPLPISTAPSLCINYDELILDVSWSSTVITDPKTPPITSYTVCDDDDCSIVVNECCSTNLTLEFDEEYNIAVISNNIVGSSDKSPQDTLNYDVFVTSNNIVGSSVESPSTPLSTYLLTSITERGITNVSAVISYTTLSTFSGCPAFPSDLEVKIDYSDCNGTTINMTRTCDYITDRTDEPCDLPSLNPECVYRYTIQVFDGMEPLGMVSTGMFTTLSSEVAGSTNGDDDVTTSISGPTPTTTPTPPTTEPPTTTTTEATLPIAAIAVGAVGGTIGLLVIPIITLVLIYFCCCRDNCKKSVDLIGARRDKEDPIPLVEKSQPLEIHNVLSKPVYSQVNKENKISSRHNPV